MIIDVKQSNLDVTIILKGNIDEKSTYDLPIFDVGKKVYLNLEGIDQINSAGIQGWIKFVESFGSELFIQKASISVISQINMFPSFMGGKKVHLLSFYAPFYCEKCDESVMTLITVGDKGLRHVAANFGSLNIKCSTCSQQMEFDGIEKKYFAFTNYSIFIDT